MDIDKLAAVQLRLDALPAPVRTTPALIIAQLLPALDAARARGVTIEGLLPVLREAGIKLSPKTVRDYMSRARKAHAAAAAPAPRPAITTRPVEPQPLLGSREGGKVAAAAASEALASAPTSRAPVPVPARAPVTLAAASMEATSPPSASDEAAELVPITGPAATDTSAPRVGHFQLRPDTQRI